MADITHFKDIPIEDMLKKLNGANQNSEHARALNFELSRRATAAQIKAADAQVVAAEASGKVLEQARNTAKWTMISAILIGISAVATAASTIALIARSGGS